MKEKIENVNKERLFSPVPIVAMLKKDTTINAKIHSSLLGKPNVLPHCKTHVLNPACGTTEICQHRLGINCWVPMVCLSSIPLITIWSERRFSMNGRWSDTIPCHSCIIQSFYHGTPRAPGTNPACGMCECYQ